MIPDIDQSKLRRGPPPPPSKKPVPFLNVYEGKHSRYDPKFTGIENQRLNKCPPGATLVEEMRRCSKRNCHCKEIGGEKHGPYIYATWYNRRKPDGDPWDLRRTQYKRYIGRVHESPKKKLDNEILELAKTLAAVT